MHRISATGWRKSYFQCYKNTNGTRIGTRMYAMYAMLTREQKKSFKKKRFAGHSIYQDEEIAINMVLLDWTEGRQTT